MTISKDYKPVIALSFYDPKEEKVMEYSRMILDNMDAKYIQSIIEDMLKTYKKYTNENPKF